MTAPVAPRAGLHALVRVLDDLVRIPGTKVGIGLDAVIGLIPGVGDVAGTALASLVVLAAARDGASGTVLARMVLNVLIDAAVGAIPILGDLFDVGFRANVRNVALLERHLADPQRTRAASGGVVALVALALLLLLVAVGAAAWFVVRALVTQLG